MNYAIAISLTDSAIDPRHCAQDGALGVVDYS
jgi:hypothetical protein